MNEGGGEEIDERGLARQQRMKPGERSGTGGAVVGRRLLVGRKAVAAAAVAAAAVAAAAVAAAAALLTK